MEGLGRFIFFFTTTMIFSTILIVEGAIVLYNESLGIARFTEVSIGGFAIALGIFGFSIILFRCYCCCSVGFDYEITGLDFCPIFIYVLVTFQILLGAGSLVMLRNDEGQLDHKIFKAVEEVFDDYVHAPTVHKWKIIDNIQQDFECCGVEGPTFWVSGPLESCYPDFDKDNEIYLDGCANKYKRKLVPRIRSAGNIAIVSVFTKVYIDFFFYLIGERAFDNYLRAFIGRRFPVEPY